ncbi:MAG: hypothetical protein JNN17_13645 [Verrucomicrobiaceae bacterium]|nr:hypothetical protein [Verrucomicrobiaceae bacterium]
MKERLVESWLSKINERGYGITFCQILASKGYRVIRYGHSSIELGKDVLAISPQGDVCAYQLKSGDVSLADVTKHIEQLQMLVATHPVHPGLPSTFVYRVFFVTTGDFKDPAIALIKELNAKWRMHRWPEVQTIGGRDLVTDLIAMSSDFWPTEAPDMRAFLELHLARGRGDLDIGKLARLLRQIVEGKGSARDVERRSAAANIFCSYALGGFYATDDHWSIFQGWTVCASTIGYMGESFEVPKDSWMPSFTLAKEGAMNALRLLSEEALCDGAFIVQDREIDQYTRVRNTTALAATAAYMLIAADRVTAANRFKPLALIAQFIERDRLVFWGEGAFSQFAMLIWFLESFGLQEPASILLQTLLSTVVSSNAPGSLNPLSDPYSNADECLVNMIKAVENNQPSPRRKSVYSYSLLPIVTLLARRDLRSVLEDHWKAVSQVRITWFRPEKPAGMLLWRCESGSEQDGGFDQPQSWDELRKYACRDDRERLPSLLRDDFEFGLMFMLAFPHRISVSLTKLLDEKLCSLAKTENTMA